MEERWFVGSKITLMLHCGKKPGMDVCWFCFKFDGMAPRKARIISSSFFGAVKYTCFGKLSLFKKFIIGSSIIPGG